MLNEKISKLELQNTIEDLRARLAEAEETLDAFRKGSVDALVITGDNGEQIFTLQGADHPYRVMVENINEGAATLSEDGVLLYANARLASMLKTPLEAILGQSFLRFLPGEDQKNFETLLARGAEDRSRGEVKLRDLDGNQIPALLSFSSLKFSGLDGICLIVTDLTEQKSSEEALRHSRSMFERLFESGPQATITLSKDGCIKRLNQKALKQFGFEPEELIGKPVDVLLCERDRQVFAELYAGVLSEPERDSASSNAEIFAVDKGGREYPVEVTLSSLQQAEELEVICIVGDITRRKRMESELAEVRRRLLESVEAERTRLSQELHDGPMQELYGISYQIKTVQDELFRLSPFQSKSLKKLSGVRENLNHIVQVLRDICVDLRPPTLEQFGLEKSIRSHASKFQQSHPEIQVNLELQPDGLLLKENLRLTLFRIYQQSLSNVLRHAKARRVTVRFQYDAENAYLEVHDDGKGFTVPESWVEFVRKGHIGLAGSAERAMAIGGIYKVVSSPGNGAVVQVAVPLTHSQ